jgi:hypothetical protein
MAVRVRHGHWLRRAGPFEVSETTAGQVGRETQTLERTIDAQRTRIAVLESLLNVWGKPLVGTNDEGDS